VRVSVLGGVAQRAARLDPSDSERWIGNVAEGELGGLGDLGEFATFPSGSSTGRLGLGFIVPQMGGFIARFV
jgi:hypothetical protein